MNVSADSNDCRFSPFLASPLLPWQPKQNSERKGRPVALNPLTLAALMIGGALTGAGGCAGTGRRAAAVPLTAAGVAAGAFARKESCARNATPTRARQQIVTKSSSRRTHTPRQVRRG